MDLDLTTSGHLLDRRREFQENIYFCFTDYVDHDNYMKFLKKWNNRPSYMPPEKLVFRSRSNRIRHETTDWFKIGKGV